MRENWKEQSSRKARVDRSRYAELDGGKEWGVFMYTLYMGRWYYSGYTAHSSQEEAEAARDDWLQKGG